MEIIVSGKRKEVTDGLTVAELLNSEKAGRPRYASVVTRKEILLDGGFEDAVLQNGDTVEFIYTGDEKC
jgi:sulfur carrier protein